mmetsp:Transcript_8348/g.15778  ORF Transcript_8348/g.15778 Transcript_8348/m.15778 type:complete len:262 (+) Transcript_8348:1-786(+)
MKLLIGNGGFDEAHIDIVSFGRLREQPFRSGGEERLRLQFDILDTCRSPAGMCPHGDIEMFETCWERCKNETGGYDGGGGPRRASPNQYGLGFTLEAPLQRAPSRVSSYRLRFGDGDMAQWLALGTCGTIHIRSCIVGEKDASKAALFTLYDTVYGANETSFSARLAIDDERRANVVRGTEEKQENWLLQNPYGFWDLAPEGTDSMEVGWNFTFKKRGAGWQVEDVYWESSMVYWGAWGLQVQPGRNLSATFKADDLEIIV